MSMVMSKGMLGTGLRLFLLHAIKSRESEKNKISRNFIIEFVLQKYE
jgi:hypothetical protein